MRTLAQPLRRLLLLQYLLLLGACLIGNKSNESEDVHTLPSWKDFYEHAVTAGDKNVYIADNDVAFVDEKGLQEFYLQGLPPIDSIAASKHLKKNTNESSSALTVKGADGLVQRWADSLKQDLTYCISDDFGDRKAAVIKAMQDATDFGWEHRAAVNFVYDEGADFDCTSANPSVLFNIRPSDEGDYIARAFLPQTARPYRELVIHQKAFADKTPLAQHLAHQAGHILGFRHTHPRAFACLAENDMYEPLTPKEAGSIMHHPGCTGAPTRLEFSADDASAAARLYGPAGTPPVTIVHGTSTKDSPTNITVDTGDRKLVAELKIFPNSNVTVRMTGQAPAAVDGMPAGTPGDADLYVRFGAAPGTTSYDCRPFLGGSDETCFNIQAPAGTDTVYVMVAGAAKATVDLEIFYEK